MSTRRAILNAVLGRYGVVILRAVAMIALARLLLPEDFGHFAIATSITGLMWMVMDFGLMNYIVTHHDGQEAAARTAVGIALALTLTTLAIGTATILALPEQFVSHEVALIAVIVGWGYLSYPLNLVPIASLQRDLRFGELSAVELVGTAVQVGSAIAFASLGHGALSLAYAALAETVARTILLSGAFGRSYLVRPSLSGWRELVPFGRDHAASNGLQAVGDILTTMIFARMLGPTAVGLFNRAKMLILLADTTVLEGVAPVILPALALELRTRGDLKQAYVRKLAFLTVFHWPLFALLALEAERVVLLFLGQDWYAAVGPMRALAVIGLFLPFTEMSFKFYVALGMVRAFAALQGIVQVARVSLTALGALHSVEGACLGFALGTHGVMALLVIPSLWRRIGYPVGDVMRELGRSGLIAALALVGPLVLFALGFDESDPWALVPACTLSAVFWFAGVILLRHPGRNEMLLAWAQLRDRLLPALLFRLRQRLG